MKPKNGSILREIEICKGYDTALFTTFNFEVSFFDRAVYPILIKGGIRNINLFIDARQLNEALSYAESGLFGRHYYVSPVNISGAFHPKVILLLGKNKAKLIVASANIKTTGYLINNEVFQTFEYTDKNREYASLIHDAVTFFKSLYMFSENRDLTTLAVLENWQIGDYEPNTGVRFISNLSSSIISQISFLANEMHGSRLRVAVPFYDQELSALEALDDIFNFSEINLYIQNQTSTFPVERGFSDEMYEKLILYPFRNINENSNSAAFYHGKVFEFINSNTCHILYGSPNCTVSALMNTYTASGNIECAILADISEEKDADFFDVFDVDGSIDIERGRFENKSVEAGLNYFFQYGELIRGNIRLQIGYQKQFGDVSVLYCDNEMLCEYRDDSLSVIIPIIQYQDPGTVFDIVLKYDGQEQQMHCWFIDEEELYQFRTAYRAPVDLGEFNSDDSDEEYSEYIEKLIEAIDNDEYREYLKKVLKKVLVQREIDNTDEEDVEQSFLLGEDAPDTYREHKRYENVHKRSAVFAHRYYLSLRLPSNYDGTDPYKPLDYPTQRTVTRKATTAERRVARLFRRYINRFLLTVDADELSYEYYKNLCGVVLDAIKRLFYLGRITDFLGLKYIMETKIAFLKVLIKKAVTRYAETGEADDDLAYLGLNILAEQGFQKDYRAAEDDLRKILLDLNGIFNFRESYKNYIKEMNLKEILISEDSGYDPNSYIDSLFGYKTYDQLKSYFRKLYGSKIKFDLTDDVFNVDINLNSETKAPIYLGNTHIETVLKSFVEAGVQIAGITIVFNESSGKTVRYEIKTAGIKASTVSQVINAGGKTNRFKCRNKIDNIWRPIYF